MTSSKNLRYLKERIESSDTANTPYYIFLNFPFVMSVTGVKSSEYFSDAKIMMDSQIETYRRIGIDPEISPDFGTVAEGSAFGAKVVYDALGFPSIRHDENTTIELLAALKPADPFSAGLLPKQLEFLEYMVSHAPRDTRVNSTNLMGPVSAAAMIRGISDFCMDIMDDVESAKTFIETITETESKLMIEQNKILRGNCERILISDDISSFLSKSQFELLAAPSYKKIYSSVPDAQRWLHNDGESVHLAGAIADCGIQFWHIGKCVDMNMVFEQTENKVAICGNLDPIKDLYRGTSEVVYKKAFMEIEQFRNTRKHICSAGGFIGYNTPADNVIAMIKAATNSNT